MELTMIKKLCVPIFSAALLAGCLSPSVDYQGYSADSVAPKDLKPGEDTRSTVMAQLGSPSTTGVFNDDTWIYMSSKRERLAFYIPKVTERSVVAVKFSADDFVDEVLVYDQDDGAVISYAARETETGGRELSLIEQLLGNVGASVIPQEQSTFPNGGNIPQ